MRRVAIDEIADLLRRAGRANDGKAGHMRAARAHERDQLTTGLAPRPRDRTPDESIGAGHQQRAACGQAPCPARGGSSRMARAGFPATTVRGGTVRVTTLPAATTARSPISTPFRIEALKPIHDLF